MTRYVALDGDDGADGTAAAPFRTLPRALAALSPGDTLVLRDGVYPPLLWDCGEEDGCAGARCPSGVPGAPVTLRAENERQARFGGDPQRRAFEIARCRDVVVEGISASIGDFPEVRANPPVFEVDTSEDVVLRRLLLFGPNRYVNAHVLRIASSQRVLVEESEVYDYHREAVFVDGSDVVTLRRNYVHSRDTPNATGEGAYSCCDLSRGDSGIAVRGSYRVLAENNVVESAGAGFTVSAIDYANPLDPDRVGDAARFLGNMVRDATFGVIAASRCEGAEACEDRWRIRGLDVVDTVVAETQVGFRMNAIEELVLRHVTSFDASESDFHLFRSDSNAGARPSAVVLRALDVGRSGTGYRIEGLAEYEVRSSWSFGNEIDFSHQDEGVVDHSAADPGLGPCRAYPPSSFASAAGARAPGAEVLFRTVDGVLTDEPLWDPASGEFPCGAVVEGVNDEATYPDATCRTVHRRFGVDAELCPLAEALDR